MKERMIIAAVIITMPLWLLIGAAWCICTGRTLKSCNAEANALSGFLEGDAPSSQQQGRDGSPQPSASEDY